MLLTIATKNTQRTYTSRCRQRRNTMTSSSTTTPIAGCQVEPVVLIQSAGPVSPGVRTAASCRSSQVLAWSPARCQG
jgi:hypothetical protein